MPSQPMTYIEVNHDGSPITVPAGGTMSLGGVTLHGPITLEPGSKIAVSEDSEDPAAVTITTA